MDKIGFVAFTVADACEFFDRCIQKEAVSLKERMCILKAMAEEKRVLLTGEFDEKTSEALGKFMEDTNHKGIIGIRKVDNA